MTLNGWCTSLSSHVKREHLLIQSNRKCWFEDFEILNFRCRPFLAGKDTSENMRSEHGCSHVKSWLLLESLRRKKTIWFFWNEHLYDRTLILVQSAWRSSVTMTCIVSFGKLPSWCTTCIPHSICERKTKLFQIRCWLQQPCVFMFCIL